MDIKLVASPQLITYWRLSNNVNSLEGSCFVKVIILAPGFILSATAAIAFIRSSSKHVEFTNTMSDGITWLNGVYLPSLYSHTSFCPMPKLFCQKIPLFHNDFTASVVFEHRLGQNFIFISLLRLNGNVVQLRHNLDSVTLA